MDFPRVRIKESHQQLKLTAGGRFFTAEVNGTGYNCCVSIDELDAVTGMAEGYRKSYRVPGRIKWSVIVARYCDDTAKRM